MRNHYVPEFLQLPWALGKSNKLLQVFRISGHGVEKYRQAPKGNAYAEDMLSLTKENVAGMDRNAVEEILLREIDQRAHDVHQKMLESGFRLLNRDDRMDWSRFIVSLRLRQPNFVLDFREDSKKKFLTTLRDQPEQYECLDESNAIPTLEEWTEQAYPGLIENIGLSMYESLINSPEIGLKILGLRWWICDFAESNHYLLLADHPCIFSNGIDHPDLAIALPISPTKSFIAIRDSRTADAMRAQSPRFLIKRLNDASVRQAEKYIYAADESSFRFIQNRRRKPPQ